jgi:ADP-heptose:LPS heptosyltransferase
VRIVLDKNEKTFAEKYYTEKFPDKSKPVFVFHAGAAKVQNRWNKENFVKLILMLYEKYNPYFLLTSGPIDGEINHYIMRQVKNHSVHCDILEKTPIRKVGAVISRAAVYLSNDTGTMHVASYVNANVIGMFGPTNGYEWGPINPKGTYIQSDTNNIDDISVDDVYNFINNYFGREQTA